MTEYCYSLQQRMEAPVLLTLQITSPDCTKEALNKHSQMA